MGKRLDSCPTWSQKALQGLVFWIGHRHSLYPNYPLGESALIAEICNLIFTNLGSQNLRSQEVLLCERQYTQLMPPGTWPSRLGLKSRADLVLVHGLTHAQAEQQKSLVNHISFVIEVKRASSARGQIDQDLKRLATFKGANPHARAFLFVVSEVRRPKRFVSSNGKAIRRTTTISGTSSHYKIRRVCKAAASFNGKESANYACIIEVFN